MLANIKHASTGMLYLHFGQLQPSHVHQRATMLFKLCGKHSDNPMFCFIW
jgi:hypothetical protein